MQNLPTFLASSSTLHAYSLTTGSVYIDYTVFVPYFLCLCVHKGMCGEGFSCAQICGTLTVHAPRNDKEYLSSGQAV